jgi:glycine/D-amino acid oxidase-like deaminating enzyme
MTNPEYLVVGQGISGTLLSWYLHKANRSFLVIDKFNASSSSRVAAGIINPVTGRRIVRTWMIETIMPFAVKAYRDIGEFLKIDTIADKKIIDFFPSAQMRLAFQERIEHGEEFLLMPDDENNFRPHFNYDLGYGVINESYVVNLKNVLSAWRDYLKNKSLLIEEDYYSLNAVTAEKTIFCDGIYSSTNKYFNKLPFALNKGEALIIECENIPVDAVYKKGLTLAPLGNNQFWAGSSHEWHFTDNLPSEQFLVSTTNILKGWLKKSFNVVERLAAIRPATVERRPFVGMHPHFPSIGILNGMGTKGCSLAPYFADQLVNHLTKNSPILPEADVSRFSRILQPSK